MSNFKKFLLLIGLGVALGVTLGYTGVQMKKEFDEPKETAYEQYSKYSQRKRIA